VKWSDRKKAMWKISNQQHNLQLRMQKTSSEKTKEAKLFVPEEK
jgi:hypothetical protein